jgi:hypothetical protein
MAEVVYLLCALTSFGCAALLLRSYLRNRTRLLVWSSLCFGALAVSNALLFVDRVLTPDDVDLSFPRNLSALVGLATLLYGLIWDAR